VERDAGLERPEAVGLGILSGHHASFVPAELIGRQLDGLRLGPATQPQPERPQRVGVLIGVGDDAQGQARLASPPSS
jgi:hypothetical protein